MKTNHQRSFKAKTHAYKGGQGWGKLCTEIGESKHIGAHISYEYSNGNRGMAKAVRGAKKFVRSRIRAHENQQLKSVISKELHDA